jgi:hypothetical protein
MYCSMVRFTASATALVDVVAALDARATGRGTPDDPDQPQGRPPAEIPEPPARVEPWEAPPVTDEQRRNAVGLIPPNQRPRVVMRYADSRDLFVSGLLDGGDEIAQRAAIIDVPLGQWSRAALLDQSVLARPNEG